MLISSNRSWQRFFLQVAEGGRLDGAGRDFFCNYQGEVRGWWWSSRCDFCCLVRLTIAWHYNCCLGHLKANGFTPKLIITTIAVIASTNGITIMIITIKKMLSDADNYRVFMFDSPKKPVNILRPGFGQRSITVWRIFSAKDDPTPHWRKIALRELHSYTLQEAE